MKIKIEYERDMDYINSYRAFTYYNDRRYSHLGGNFEEAKELLIEHMKEVVKAENKSIPEPEEVEIWNTSKT